MSYLPFLSTETWTLLVVLLTLIVVYGYWPYGVFTKMGVPGPRPIPFFGTMLEYRRGFTTFDAECFNKYGKTWGVYDGRQPTLCTTDVSLIKAVLVKGCYSLFTNRRKMPLNGEFQDSLSLSEDGQWKRIRGILSPAFTSGRLKEMFVIMKQHSANLVRSIQRKVDQKEDVLDLKELFGPYSMDVVTSTAFSVDIDSYNNPSDPFVTNLKKLLKYDIYNTMHLIIVLFPFLVPILEMLEFSFYPKSTTKFFCVLLTKIKANRAASQHKSRVDSLQIMMDSQTKMSENGEEHIKGLTDHELLSQAMTFIFASYETTSSSLSFLSYNLALNPEVMTQLQKEIDSTFPNQGAVDYETLSQMEYLDSVVNESLRLYTIGARVERVANETVELNGLVIPKGTIISIPIWVMHRDPALWQDPEEFRPERFSKENKVSMDPYTYMPFGAGPRNCLGMRFALLSMKLAMVEILQKFSFAVCDKTEIPIEMIDQGLLMPKRPILIKLVPRVHANEEAADQ